MKPALIPEGENDTWQFILDNRPRRKILKSILTKGDGYLKQLTEELELTKRTVLLQLTELRKKGLLVDDWKTVYVGEKRRPVYLRSYNLDPKYKWLQELQNLM